MRMNLFKLFSSKKHTTPETRFQSATEALVFDELNPLLAKQLSEMEAQIGQLARVQFDLAEERQRMRFEMEALKKAMEDSQGAPSKGASQINSENGAT